MHIAFKYIEVVLLLVELRLTGEPYDFESVMCGSEGAS